MLLSSRLLYTLLLVVLTKKVQDENTDTNVSNISPRPSSATFPHAVFCAACAVNCSPVRLVTPFTFPGLCSLWTSPFLGRQDCKCWLISTGNALSKPRRLKYYLTSRHESVDKNNHIQPRPRSDTQNHGLLYARFLHLLHSTLHLW